MHVINILIFSFIYMYLNQIYYFLHFSHSVQTTLRQCKPPSFRQALSSRLEFQQCNTLVLWFSINNTFGDMHLTSSPHTNAVDDIAMFCLVTETTSFVWPGKATHVVSSSIAPPRICKHPSRWRCSFCVCLSKSLSSSSFKVLTKTYLRKQIIHSVSTKNGEAPFLQSI